MSTQHPDNAAAPPYAVDGVIKGDGEINRSRRRLHASAAMSRCGTRKVRTPIPTSSRNFLATTPTTSARSAGWERDTVITLRVPNPAIEVEMRKLMVEALQGVPTAFDVAHEFYGDDLEPPIQEIILPFTSSAGELSRIVAYYENFIVGQESSTLLGRRIRSRLDR